MKIQDFFPFVAAACLMMTSCRNGNENEPAEPTVPVSFNLNPIGLDGLFPMTDQETRATTPATMKPTNLLILDVVNNKVVERNTREITGGTDDLLQTQTLNLTYGTHTLYFLICSTQYDAVDKEHLTVSWGTAKKLNYVWAKKMDITVAQNTTGTTATPLSYNLDLDIVVAQVKLKCDGDTYPSNIGEIKAVSEDLCWTLDLPTMQGVAGDVTVAFDLKSYANKPGQTLTLYTFVPEGDENGRGEIGQIVYTAYTNAETPTAIISHTLTDVPVQKGFITQYSGSFFGTNAPFTYSLEDTWENTIDMTY